MLKLIRKKGSHLFFDRPSTIVGGTFTKTMVYFPPANIFLDGFGGSVQTSCRLHAPNVLWLCKLLAMSGHDKGYFRNVSWAHRVVYLLVCITYAWLVLHRRGCIIISVSLVVVLMCTINVFVLIH